MFSLDKIVRKNIKALQPYSSARDEFKGEARVYLDANENSLGSVLNGYNRYPDPVQLKLRNEISKIKNIDSGNIFLGNGSDECIDILYRCFCEPYRDNVVICPPTYGMYQVSANINAVGIKYVPLTAEFDLDEEAICKAIDADTKLLWICSPNNPTGNLVSKDVVTRLVNNFEGIVVIDEAYIDFADQQGFLSQLKMYPNLVVLQTFSKAWGLAGLRLGMAFASPGIISILNKVKPPYNINQATQELVSSALCKVNHVGKKVAELKKERRLLANTLQGLDIVQHIYPSDSNFLLVKFSDSKAIFEYLLKQGIVVRDRSSTLNCGGCLRITIGTPEENVLLVSCIKQFSKQFV
jgi:histidinol-phosphate aminotransferase